MLGASSPASRAHSRRDWRSPTDLDALALLGDDDRDLLAVAAAHRLGGVGPADPGAFAFLVRVDRLGGHLFPPELGCSDYDRGGAQPVTALVAGCGIVVAR